MQLQHFKKVRRSFKKQLHPLYLHPQANVASCFNCSKNHTPIQHLCSAYMKESFNFEM